MPSRTDFSFYELVPGLAPLSLVDVGAAPGDKPPPYQGHLDRGHATVASFEPDPVSFARLKEKAGPRERLFPYFIGEGGPATYYQNVSGYTGSLFPPNHKFVARFSGLADLVKPVSTQPVTTHRLDDVLPDELIDFLKLDVQGGELGVLKGAARLLPTVLVAEVELEFVPLYVGQPLFADIDSYMRGKGFQLHTFTGIRKYFYLPVQKPSNPMDGVSQVMFTDGIYIPDLETADQLPRERLLKLVSILHDFYNSWDLCFHLLKVLADRGEEGPFDAYAARLGLG